MIILEHPAQPSKKLFFHVCRPEVSGVLLVIGGVCGNSMGHHLRIALGRGDLPLRSNCFGLRIGTPDGSHKWIQMGRNFDQFKSQPICRVKPGSVSIPRQLGNYQRAL